MKAHKRARDTADPTAAPRAFAQKMLDAAKRRDPDQYDDVMTTVEANECAGCVLMSNESNQRDRELVLGKMVHVLRNVFRKAKDGVFPVPQAHELAEELASLDEFGPDTGTWIVSAVGGSDARSRLRFEVFSVDLLRAFTILVSLS